MSEFLADLKIFKKIARFRHGTGFASFDHRRPLSILSRGNRALSQTIYNIVCERDARVDEKSDQHQR
jgi:hypothetical protein